MSFIHAASLLLIATSAHGAESASIDKSYKGLPSHNLSLGDLYDMHRRRRMTNYIDMALWDDDNEDVECAFNEDNGMIDCRFISDDGAFKVDEKCIAFEDGAYMSCTICAESTEKRDFELCYAVTCDFSSFLLSSGATARESSFFDLEREDCTCEYARINGKECDFCAICPKDTSGKNDAGVASSRLFGNLAFQCPHQDLPSAISSGCSLDETVSIKSPQYDPTVAIPKINTNDETRNGRPRYHSLAFLAVVVVFGFAAYVIAWNRQGTSLCRARRNQRSFSANQQGFSDVALT